MSKKSAIIKIMDTAILGSPHPDGLPLVSEADRFRAFFVDKRPNGSMQLTPYGFSIMKGAFPYWQVELQEDLVVGDHVYLTRVAPAPYFLDGKVLTTFNARFGVMIVLTDGDMTKIRKNHPADRKIG